MNKSYIVIFFVLLSIPLIFGFEWPFGKTSYCQFGNYTNQSDCDINWCNNVLTNQTQTCNFNLNEQICKCQIITLNETNQTNQNQTQTQTITLYDYYNKTEIDNKTEELKKYIENMTLTLRNNMLDRIDNASAPIFYGNDEDNNSTPTPWFVWPLVALIVVGGLFAISKRDGNPYTNVPLEAIRQNKPIKKQIQTTQQKSEEVF